MKWPAAFGMALALATPVTAGTAAPGSISHVFHIAMYGGVVLFDSSGARTSPPSCQLSAAPQQWSINVSTIAGQSALTALLAALAMHKTITIYGSGTCSAWDQAETVDYFLIND